MAVFRKAPTGTMVFSSGCAISVFTNDISTSDGIVIFVTDDLGVSHDNFEINPSIKKLSHHFSSVFFDSRGTGESKFPLSGKISAIDLSDDLKCVVNHVKNAFAGVPVYLYASSYGAIAALLFLRRFPNEVEKIILDSPMIYPAYEKIQITQINQWKKTSAIFPAELAKVIEEIPLNKDGMETLLTSEQLSKFVNANQPLRHGTELICYYYAMNEFITTCDLRGAVSDSKTSILMLYGDKDTVVSPEVTSSLLIANKHIYATKFPNYGHKIYKQNSDEFTRICCEFLYG